MGHVCKEGTFGLCCRLSFFEGLLESFLLLLFLLQHLGDKSYSNYHHRFLSFVCSPEHKLKVVQFTIQYKGFNKYDILSRSFSCTFNGGIES